MKFTAQYRGISPPEASAFKDEENDFPDLVWPNMCREIFEEPEMQSLALIRRQKGNVISMKLVLRSHEAE